jgi:hypothetical protein
MPRKITVAELARMTTEQTGSMNDTCAIYRSTHYQDSDTGQLMDGFDSGTFSVFCGLATGPEFRNERGQVVTIDADAVLRLASAQGIAVGDRVVARGKTYSVDGAQLGHNVNVVTLQEIKT